MSTTVCDAKNTCSPTPPFPMKQIVFTLALAALSVAANDFPKILTQYDQQGLHPRGSPLNVSAIVALLQETNANSFSYLLWSTDGQEYLDFVRMLSLTSNLTMHDGVPFRMWLTLIPPTEVQNNQKCSIPTDSPLTPFNETELFNSSLGYKGCTDYIAWADVVGRLGRLYPHFYALNIDDFSSNTETFTKPYLTHIRRKLAGSVRLIPTFYYGKLNTQPWLGQLTDGVLFYFRNDREGQNQCRNAPACNASATCSMPCLCGVCAESSVRNLPVEVGEFATALPPGHLIFVGIYFGAYGGCSPAPSTTYNRRVLEAALALPSVSGATIYTTRTPAGAASECAVDSEDKGCVVRHVFDTWNRSAAAVSFDAACPQAKPFLVGKKLPKQGGGQVGKEEMSSSTITTAVAATGQVCCDEVSSLASGCTSGNHGCCLWPGAFGCPAGMPACFCPSEQPYEYGNAAGGKYCCDSEQGLPANCVGGGECCLIPGINPSLLCQGHAYCNTTGDMSGVERLGRLEKKKLNLNPFTDATTSLLFHTAATGVSDTIILPNQIPGRAPVVLPVLSLGTGGYNNSQVEDIVLTAYASGFRAVHTAFDYYNVDGVGSALKQIPRSSMFITAMTSPCIHTAGNPKRNVTDPQACKELTIHEVNETLSKLGVEYVDLLLLHGPSEPFGYTGACSSDINAVNLAQWKAYEVFLKEGRALSIGVSNFCPSCLEGLSWHGLPRPSVNQIQWHVGMGSDPEGLMSYCKENDIVVQAYAPLAAGAVVNDSLCASIGLKYNRTGAEIGLRFVVQHELTAAVVRSSHSKYLIEDLETLTWELEEKDMKLLSAATEPKGQQDGRPSWGCTK